MKKIVTGNEVGDPYSYAKFGTDVGYSERMGEI